MKKLFLLISLLYLMGCLSNERDMIFHYSVLEAPDNGVLEGNMKVGELKKYGDFGLGTFNKPNGEMIILDHVVYRITPEGKIIQPDDEALIPYSVITFYRQDDTLSLSGEINTAGFHLHFLSDDNSIGGHLMEFTFRSLEIGYDTKSTYKILLPDTENFREGHFRGEAVNY